MIWEKVALFLLTVLSAAGLLAVWLAARKRRKEAISMALTVIAQKIIDQERQLKRASHILMAYKNYYNCCESDRDYLVDAARIALHAVIKKCGTDPFFAFLKDEEKS